LHEIDLDRGSHPQTGGIVATGGVMAANPHCVYILESISEPARHYTGLTSDIPARIAWHNAGLSSHTAKHRPWRLLVSMNFADSGTAIHFERYLKSGSGRAFARRHFSYRD